MRRRWLGGVAVAVAVTVLGVGGPGDPTSTQPVSSRPTEVLGGRVARTDAAVAAPEAEPAEPALVAPSGAAGEVPIKPPPAFVSPRSAVPRSAPPRRRLPSGERGTWALIVGVNDYPGEAHDLRFAVNDADDVDAALAAFGVPAERRLVLRDGAATAGAIAAGVDWLVDHAGEDAVAVVSFAGHARERNGDRQSFVAADGVELSDLDLAARLAPLRARATWLNFATCFAGGFVELLAPGRTLVAAAPAGSLAYENTSIGRSYLGHYMVRAALRSSPEGDVRAAFASAREAIRRDYPDRVPVEIPASTDVIVHVRPPAHVATDREAPTPPPAAPPPSEPSPAPPASDPCAGMTLGVVRCR